ncbi:HhH-GPD family protein [Dehalogenimonas lykanthroporepellens BL-DC-9]|jgi:endonuclease-3 related protein|nr:HhH-GPD family protein [Dehalogenimonas lykanthroporepellens BL-DC-9]
MGNPTPASAGLIAIYERLFGKYGPQDWWPADTAFEMMIGAILTQSTAWSNVEKAITGLKSAGALSAAQIRRMRPEELAPVIRSSGYYNAKASKLKALADWLAGYDDDIESLKDRDPAEFRRELLAVHGVGPETADSILLYALDVPVFVIDAYTRRLFSRLGIVPPRDTYDEWQRLFETNLEQQAGLFNEYHALIVRHAKEVCRSRPDCAECCLAGECRYLKRGY